MAIDYAAVILCRYFAYQSLQNKALKLVPGALRGSPNQAIEIELLFLLELDLKSFAIATY